ncbi:MAG: hypothetical protein AAGA90_08495 [Actinomycetota bacterium]
MLSRLAIVRSCAVVGLGAALAVAISGVPARPGTVPPVATVDGPLAPEVTVPSVDAAAARVVEPRSAGASPTTTAPAATPGDGAGGIAPVATVPAEPDHLVPVADDAPAPQPVVTTTTTIAAPSTSAAPAPVATVAFTAEQAYGSCGEAVPYDVFSGTATPGSAVSITSPHGSATAVADPQGHWSATVEFPSAPRGDTFTVSVTGLGGSTSFAFTATGESHT